MARLRELTDEHRAALLAKGYKPVEIWVPDVTSQAYRNEAVRQSKSAAAADEEDDVMEWVESVSRGAWDES